MQRRDQMPRSSSRKATTAQAFTRSAKNSIIDAFFKPVISLTAHGRYINLWERFRGTKERRLVHGLVDVLGTKLDSKLGLTIETRKCLFGRKGIGGKRSAVGHLFDIPIIRYLDGWKKAMDARDAIPSIRRKKQAIPRVWTGWKSLRDEVCPNFKPSYDPGNDRTIMILPDDTMTPKERINNLVEFKEVDRVGIGFLFSHISSFMGAQPAHDIGGLWQYTVGPGAKMARAAINAWLRIGGLDFLPMPMNLMGPIPMNGNPFPDSHSMFYYDWRFPTDANYEQFIENELFTSYEQLTDWGLTSFAREISASVLRLIFVEMREILKAQLAFGRYFPKAFTNLFETYAGSMFTLWDVVPMARGMIPFMKDLKKRPAEVIEAFEFLEPGLTEIGLALAKFSRNKYLLIGNSRGSSSWISPKMFETIFWPTMKRTWEKIVAAGCKVCAHLDNDWTGNMSYFMELPKHSGFFHLDQADLPRVRDIVGDKFCLMGNLQPAITAGASPGKVYTETRRLIETCGKDGGYIVASGCEMPVNVPVENIYAIKRAVRDAGYFKR